MPDQNQAVGWSIRLLPDQNQAAAWSIRHMPDQNKQKPDRSGCCLIKIRQLPDRSGIFQIKIWGSLIDQAAAWSKSDSCPIDQDSGLWEVYEKYANARICVFSVWPLSKVQKWFQKQIWNENVYISIQKNFLMSFAQYLKKHIKKWISNCILKLA